MNGSSGEMLLTLDSDKNVGKIKIIYEITV